MARTKQTARVSLREAESARAHTVLRNIAAAQAAQHNQRQGIKIRDRRRKQSLNIAKSFLHIQNFYQINEATSSQMDDTNPGGGGQPQQTQQDSQQEGERPQGEQQGEQGTGEQGRQQGQQGEQGGEQGTGGQGGQQGQEGEQGQAPIDIDRIFVNLQNIVDLNTGNPLIASRTPLPTFNMNTNMATEEEERRRYRERTPEPQTQPLPTETETPTTRRRKEGAQKVKEDKRARELREQRQEEEDRQREAKKLRRETEQSGTEEQRKERRQKFKNDAPPWKRQQAPPPPPKAKRKYKFKPGTAALREIRKYQKSTELIIPKAPFVRLVKEIIDQYADRADRVQANAIQAMQEASEDILTSLFQDSVLCHAHAKRVTLKTVDMALAMRLRQDNALHK